MKIEEMEKQINLLSTNLLTSQKIVEENLMYKNWFTNISGLVRTSKSKGKDLEKLI